jgi:hypothetical protein
MPARASTRLVSLPSLQGKLSKQTTSLCFLSAPAPVAGKMRAWSRTCVLLVVAVLACLVPQTRCFNGAGARSTRTRSSTHSLSVFHVLSLSVSPHTLSRASTCAFVCVCVCICMYIWARVCVCIYVCMYARKSVYTYVCVCMYIITYI